MSRVIAERHSITAGSQFDGQVPSTDEDFLSGVLTYASDTQGGLFVLPPNRVSKVYDVPEDKGQVRVIKSLRVMFGGQSSWTIKITNGTDEFTWLSGTTDTSLVVTDEIELMPNEELKLETIGASTAMFALVVFELSRKVD
jgi:hypothetical protein